MTEKKTNSLPPIQWETLPDEELLKVRVRDLSLSIKGTGLEERIQRLYAELDAHGISFHPPCYLADEWLCPDRKPIIGIPFYLAHPRLMQLERRLMLEVEGGTEAWCMKLLRHEAGHALNYAFCLYRRTRWRELFGPFSARYYAGDYYTQPYSRRYVIHLEDNYAQAHPDEDFAETFAVWLAPGSSWQKKYQGWPALKKLQYVDHVIRSINGRAPLVITSDKPWSAARMRSTLAAYYERRRRYLGDDFPGFYDPGLLRIFFKKPGDAQLPPAEQFLRRYRRYIITTVATWTGQRKFDVDKLVGKLTARCRDMELYLHKPELEVLPEVVAFVTAVLSNVHIFKGGHSHHEPQTQCARHDGQTVHPQ